MNDKATKLYNALACNVPAVNGSTGHRVGITPLISVKTHQKTDYANLALLYGLFASDTIKRDKRP